LGKRDAKSNNYLKYTGMAMQLLVLLSIFLFAGQWLDQHFAFQKKYFTAFLPFIGLIAYFVKVYYDLME